MPLQLVIAMVFCLCSFGFVDFASVEEAKAAVDGAENIEVDGHVLSIEFKTPRPPENGEEDHC